MLIVRYDFKVHAKSRSRKRRTKRRKEEGELNRGRGGEDEEEINSTPRVVRHVFPIAKKYLLPRRVTIILSRWIFFEVITTLKSLKFIINQTVSCFPIAYIDSLLLPSSLHTKFRYQALKILFSRKNSSKTWVCQAFSTFYSDFHLLQFRRALSYGFFKKSFHESEGKTALKNEDDLAQS